MVVSAGWYIALVSLWPADSRPYIGGSTDNSLLQLALGYNGIDRVVGGDGGPRRRRAPGRWTRRCRQPVLRWRSRHRPAVRPVDGNRGVLAAARGADRSGRRTVVHPAHGSHRPRPRGLLLWGGWLLVTGAVFSFMDGTIHPYYTVALAPAIAALVGISVRELWRGKEFLAPRIVLAAMSAATGRLGVHPAGPHAGLVAGVALDRAGRIGRRGLGACGRCAPVGPRHRRPGRRRNPFRCGRDGGLHRRNRGQCAQRADDHVRAPARRRGSGGPGGRGPGGADATTPRWRRSSRTPTTVGPQPLSDR